MPIDFDAKRWKRVERDYGLWWEGNLNRPLVSIQLSGYDTSEPEPAVPSRGFTSYYDFSITPEQIVDRWNYDLSRSRFLGDAFPAVCPNFGPGVLAAFLGSELYNGELPAETVWFHPKQEREIGDISFKLDMESRWFKRVRDIMAASGRRWNGLVQVGMTDIGGNLDVLSSFRPGEKLLFDLYDTPDEVKRLTREEHETWWRAFDELNSVLLKTNRGYTAWTPIFSKEPYYMLQCDFCYMIGPEMFDEFVKPELTSTCGRLKNAFYHLDGPGQLAHLDSLLTIEDLKGVQWVPGAGQPDNRHWPEVYRKIHKAGKRIQIFMDTLESLDAVANQIGTAEGIILMGWADRSMEKQAIALCEKYGAT